MSVDLLGASEASSGDFVRDSRLHQWRYWTQNARRELWRELPGQVRGIGPVHAIELRYQIAKGREVYRVDGSPGLVAGFVWTSRAPLSPQRFVVASGP